ncbi:MAG: hypothetical protein ACJ798_12860 [Phenylobacterium sp.]
MTQARRQTDGRRRLLTAAASAVAHAAVIGLLLFAHAEAPQTEPEIEPIPIALVAPPKPPEPPAPPTEDPKPPTPKTPPPPKLHARPPRAPPPPDVAPLPAAKGPVAQGTADVSDAELASASTADSGGGGKACNMTAWLQAALRKDPLVKAAVAEAHQGKALRIWNGDWIRHGEQEGAGLAAAREAIMWEVGFAPLACRNEPVHGLVLISLNDGPGAARLVLGAGNWRWSDLLGPRRGAPREVGG